MSKPGKIYFIGGGPGDPSLITVKGGELLARASLVLAPGFFRETYAPLLAGKECLDPFDFHHAELVEKIKSYLDEGRDVAFLVPGDLAIFSPVQSIIDCFRGSAEVVPGVSAMNAASAVLKRTFDLPGVSHSTIATSPKTITGSPDTIAALSKHQSTMVLFMNNKPAGELSAELSEGYGPDTPVAVIYSISMPGQEVVMTTLSRLAADVDPERFGDEDVFKLVVVGAVLTATEDPAWWDRRKDMRDARHAAKKARVENT
ncbi:MAG TPA: SAM-dependent methyltransferase [Nitrospirota bacterium]|nr:SAM-dependent methyltransferase [Nitrospirota bacterium]